LLEQVGNAQHKPSAKKTGRKAVPVTAEKVEPPPAEPLSADPAVFWARGDPADDVIGEVQTPPLSAALPKRLGNFPFWRGEERFLDALELLYRQASQRGLEVFLGERAGDKPH
jgi:uncharacterized Zn finger protein